MNGSLVGHGLHYYFFAADYTEISTQITFLPRITQIFANLTEGDFVYESRVIDFVIRGI